MMKGSESPGQGSTIYTKKVVYELELEEVFHIGQLERRLKGKDSQEGAGLSVSLDPAAWLRIAQLGGNPTYCLRRAGGRFLDFQAACLDEEEVAKVTHWAIERGYIAPVKAYRLWSYDSEEDREGYMEFDSMAGLLEEVGGKAGESLSRARQLAREEGRRITQAKGWQVRPLALERARHSRPESIYGLDFAFLFYAEDETDLDGVWWAGEEPERGCIFESRLAGWEKEKIEEVARREEIEEILA
jgi:hypothetical protein